MDSTKKKKVIIVTGPTAVGKTSVAIAIAKHFETSIISADSRQCYSELNIGVARPSKEELNSIPHFFITSHSIKDEVTAKTFEEFAVDKANELFTKHDVIVLVGGTGLYIKAFCEGLDNIPEIDPAIRNKIINDYDQNGLDWLQRQLKEKDSAYFNAGEMKNPQRIMRALEVIESTGNSILSYQKGEKYERNFSVIKIGLNLPKDELISRINSRVDLMMKNGLLDEVKKLVLFKQLNALQTVGYKELFEYLEGGVTIEQAIERIKINTRQYAKRQLTWFKKDDDITWFEPEKFEMIIDFLDSKIKNPV